MGEMIHESCTDLNAWHGVWMNASDSLTRYDPGANGEAVERQHPAHEAFINISYAYSMPQFQFFLNPS